MSQLGAARHWQYMQDRYCEICHIYMGRHTRADKRTCSAKCRKALSRKRQAKNCDMIVEEDVSTANCDTLIDAHEHPGELSHSAAAHVDLDHLKRDISAGAKFRLLDLCCCAGGAAVGYALAGFSVTGIDIAPQPDYPFEFIQSDCLVLTYDFLLSFDAIHASPPCQQYSRATFWARRRGKTYPDLYRPVKRMLEAAGKPYIIENVPGSPLKGIRLYGDQFGLGVLRERIFESNVDLKNDLPRNQQGSVKTGEYVTVAGKNKAVKRWPDAMGIHWTDSDHIREEIPPAYTQYLGRQLYEKLLMSQLNKSLILS